jgi:phage shock protein PspC (stress-responsive transcriptional regulator)
MLTVEDALMNPNPLTRSRRHRVIAGVCGGFARWLGWSPTTFRVLFVLVSVLSAAFPGIIVYLVLWLAMPLEDTTSEPAADHLR